MSQINQAVSILSTSQAIRADEAIALLDSPELAYDVHTLPSLKGWIVQRKHFSELTGFYIQHVTGDNFNLIAQYGEQSEQRSFKVKIG